jgi:signal transduction histidine kinase
MLQSLQLRFLATMLIVVIVTVSTVGLLAQQIALSEFQRFLLLSDERNQQFGQIVQQAAHLQETDPITREANVQQMARELGQRVVLVDSQGIVQADSELQLRGQPMAAVPLPNTLLLQFNPQLAIGQSPTVGSFVPALGAVQIESLDFAQPADVVVAAAQPVTQSVFFVSAPVSSTMAFEATNMVQVAEAPLSIRWPGLAQPDPMQEGFASGLNQSLLIASAVAGVVALLLTWLLSRQVLRPVAELTKASQRMAMGDLAYRVAIPGDHEIGKLGRAFNSMAQALQHGEQLRRTMVGDVAHELRTPLTNIQGYLEAMRDGLVRPDAAMIDSLHEEALLLNRLVADLQDVALAEAGQLSLNRAPADLTVLLEHAVRAIQPRMQAKGVACTTDIAEPLPVAYLDSERISQVLRNLLNNALTHTAADGQIMVSANYSLEDGQGMYTICVADTGCGIAPEEIPLIFERFYRADPSRNRATGGSGLGLTIVRQLVEAHGGIVSVESTLGIGTCFTVRLASRS